MGYRYFVDTTEHYALMDAAKARANELRDEALDAMWNEAGERIRLALRAANRFAHSLARHRQLRRQHGL